MGLLFLEALGAMVILIAIVWWTMFSGRRKGELPDRAPDAAPPVDTVAKGQDQGQDAQPTDREA